MLAGSTVRAEDSASWSSLVINYREIVSDLSRANEKTHRCLASLGHKARVVQRSEHAHRPAAAGAHPAPLDEVDRPLQLASKALKLPLDSLALVLELLEDKHVVIEELLESLRLVSTGRTSCGRTSFVRLMQSCSNPFCSKISNPAMSSTPMKVRPPRPPSRLLLIRLTIHPKSRSYSALASASSSLRTCALVRLCSTHSRPALMRGRRSDLVMLLRSSSRSWQIFSSGASEGSDAWSVDVRATGCRFPRWRIAERTRKRWSCSVRVKPTVSSAVCRMRQQTCVIIWRERTYAEQSPLLAVIHALDVHP